MKRFASVLSIALVLAFSSAAHAVTSPIDPTPQFPSPTDPGPNPERRGPIDPFPPPTFSVVLQFS